MDLRIPHGHLVMLVGPSAVGKSTLARRICREAPTDQVEVVAADREVGKALVENGFDLETMAQGFMVCLSKIALAHQRGALAILDVPCVAPMMLTMVFDLMDMMELPMPVILVKMYPDHKLQVRFAKYRGQATTEDERFLREQHEDFAEIAKTDLSSEFPRVRNEFLVTDPQDIKLKFVW